MKKEWKKGIWGAVLATGLLGSFGTAGAVPLSRPMFVDPLVYSHSKDLITGEKTESVAPPKDFLCVLEASASALGFKATGATARRMWELTGRPGVQTAHRVKVVFDRIASLRKAPGGAVVLKSSLKQALDKGTWKQVLKSGGAIVAFFPPSSSLKGALAVVGLTDGGTLRVWREGEVFTATGCVLSEAEYVVATGGEFRGKLPKHHTPKALKKRDKDKHGEQRTPANRE